MDNRQYVGEKFVGRIIDGLIAWTLIGIIFQIVFFKPGQSIGRQVMKIAVHNEQGERLQFGDMFLRSLLKWALGFFTCGIVTIISIIFVLMGEPAIHDRILKTHTKYVG